MNTIIKTFGIYFLFAPALTLEAQSGVDSVLHRVERNSTTLQALRQQTEAMKLANRTGIYLANPEVEVARMWGRPSAAGNRVDVNVMQTFDFPTAYAWRRKIAEGDNRIAALEYESRRREVLSQAGVLCVELVYRNRLGEELNRRLQHAQRIAASVQERFVQGDAGAQERNRSQLNLLNARKAVESNGIERTELLSELQRMNGGQAVVFDDTDYPACPLPQDFEQWYERVQANHPALQRLSRETETSRHRERLNRAMGLPRFSAGYTSETVVDVSMRGVAVGMSIPLWENKNTVKQAKAQTLAWQSMETDARLQSYNALKTQYNKALSLQNMLADYARALQSAGNAEGLWKSLELGQISLTDYLLELSIYYEATGNMLQAERDYRLAALELKQWEMTAGN